MDSPMGRHSDLSHAWTSRKRAVLVLSGLCVSLSFAWRASSAFGAPENPKEFYSNNYAAAPNDQAPGGPPRQNESAKRVTTGGTVSGPSGSVASVAKPAGVKKRKILVNVFVNSANKDHFLRIIEEVIRLHDQKQAFVISVEHVGDYRSVTPDIEGALSKRGIQLYQISSVPAELEVSASPAWLIRTKQGTHIAEGFARLSQMINEWGEYVPRDPATPTPEQKLEGF